MKKPTETALVKACLALLDLYHIPTLRNNSGAAQYGKRWVHYGAKGSADILGWMPPDGRGICIECKLPGKKPTAEQESWLAWVRKTGALCVVIESVKQLEEVLRDEGYGL